MIITAKECYLTYSGEEFDLIRAAMDLYAPAVASDFTEDRLFARLVKEADSYVNWSLVGGPSFPVPALIIAVWWNALNYWIDAERRDRAQADAAFALIRAIAPYADFDTAVDAYFAAKERT